MDIFLRWLIIALLSAPNPPAKIKPEVQAASLKLLATTAAIRHNLPPALVHRVIQIESGWRITAFKYEARLQEGSVGLMQILPSTARLPASELFKPNVNVEAGCRELARCIRLADGNIRRGLVCSGGRPCPPDYTKVSPEIIRRALVCYNGGPGCLQRKCPSAESYSRLL